MEASFLPSLQFFYPQFMSLASPHRLLKAAASKPYEVAKARIQILFLSSQYPCGSLTRHWSKQNPMGLCKYPLCSSQGLVETVKHILLVCPAYTTARKSMFIKCISHVNPETQAICMDILLSQPADKILQLLLDCSSLPEVIQEVQKSGDSVISHVFRVTT